MSIIEKALEKLETEAPRVPTQTADGGRKEITDSEQPSESSPHLELTEGGPPSADTQPAAEVGTTQVADDSTSDVPEMTSRGLPRTDTQVVNGAPVAPATEPVFGATIVPGGPPAAPSKAVPGPSDDLDVDGLDAAIPASSGSVETHPSGVRLAVPATARRDVAAVDASVSGDTTKKRIDLDYAALAAAGIITPDTAQSAVAEQVRIIKRPLLLKAALSGADATPNSNVIQVSSALPSEGKTFTSVNLAMSIAMELDRTVLLVDADTARSDVARILGVDEQEGLSDYLINRERPLSEFLVKTDMPKLTVLPAGKHYANMTELFASDDMKAVVDEMAARYSDRIVIFDTAPLLATSGASVIAHLVGQIVLVVEAVRTPQSAVREALAMIEGISHDNVGIVLNKSRDRMGGQYGYGYGYGYGYYFGGKR